MSQIKYFLFSWNADNAASEYAQGMNSKYYNWLDSSVNFISQNQHAAKLIDDFQSIISGQDI